MDTTEIQQLFADCGSPPSGYALYAPLNAAAGDTVRDYSGNGFDGEIVGTEIRGRSIGEGCEERFKIEEETYRYAFQGQERETELFGSNSAYNFTYRVHDPRIGRFLSIDPLTKSYP